MRARLQARGVEWPAAIDHLDAVASTNDWLKERAREGVPEWSAVLAGVQTAGRGRHHHSWGSAPGNLHLSVLVRPQGDVATWGRLPLLAGLAVAEGIAGFGVEPALKWPNDVMIAGRKVAGVLVESSSSGGALESAVIGVGINVASVPEALDADARSAAACLADFGAAPDVADVAAAVLARIRVWYHRLAVGGSGEMMAAWRARALPWWGRHVEAKSGDEVLRGRAIDVDDGGALILLLDDGTTTLLHAGEVRELRAGAPASPR